MLLRDLHLEDF